MGVRQSKQNAFTNDLREQSETPISNDNETTDKCCLFCPIPKSAIPSSSSSSNILSSSRNSSHHALTNSSSRNNSGSALYNAEDGGFGTPLPDTPVHIRRKRDAAMEKYYQYGGSSPDGGEEKKSSSFGRVNRLGGGSYQEGVGSSRYGGLEKETAAMFEHENVSNGGRQIHNKKLPTAGIYEGPVSALYLFSLRWDIEVISCVTFCNVYIYYCC